jgi:hypothetical protein
MFIEKFEEIPGLIIYKEAMAVENFVDLIEQEAAMSWPYLEWYKSGIGEENSSGEYRTSLEMPLHPVCSDSVVERLEPIRDLFADNIFKYVNECIWDYRNLYELPLRADSGWQVLKYSHDAEYHVHHDHAPDNARVISVVASLGSECVGGELEFPYFKKTIKLSKNDIAIFPSNFPYTHIAHPVTSGVKYSLVSWLM